ncbi:thr operon leader peptide [Arsenophonus endosymbiont of Aphis craccivora]|nr:thr operon leader peptide [Arsenophonus endosymbiont of Aphis craccivora]
MRKTSFNTTIITTTVTIGYGAG